MSIRFSRDRMDGKSSSEKAGGIGSQFRDSAFWQAIKIAGIYFLVGSLWIILSDKIVGAIFTNLEVLVAVNIAKGWLYVLTTAALLFFLIRIELSRVIESKNAIRRVNASLEQSNTLFSAILESSPDMIFYSLDRNYRYTAFNLRQKENALFLWKSGISVGSDYFAGIPSGEKQDEVRKTFDRALSGEYFSFVEETGTDKEALNYWHMYFAPIHNPEHEIVGLTCFTMNVTALKRAQEKNIYLSYHDVLTGLYNRRYYEEALLRIDNENVLPMSVIIGDLNGLKLVNDAFGHTTGDELLQNAADVMTSVCRKEDIVARWGGDEFIILLPGANDADTLETVNKIKKACARRSVRSIPVDLSFGYYTRKDTSEPMRDVLKNAEDIMFKNKIIESRSMRSQTVRVIMHTLHEKNPREEAHSTRVGEICKKIGEAMELSEQEVRTLHMIGFLHDIGKIAIDEQILNKPGRLTEEEFEQIKMHPEIGCRIIRASYEVTEISESILSHHERWNGTGYPKGLKGEEIPLFSRIIAVADSYDAMTAVRTYRKALSVREAIDEIQRCSGTMYDPTIAKIFCEKVASQLETQTNQQGFSFT